MKQTIEESLQHYITGWNEQERPDIIAAFEKCLTAGCTYNDKNTPLINGLQGIADLAVQSLEKMPGRAFSRISEVDHFDNKGRYYWRVSFTNVGSRDCMDYIEFNDDNMISRIVGFV